MVRMLAVDDSVARRLRIDSIVASEATPVVWGMPGETVKLRLALSRRAHVAVTG